MDDHGVPIISVWGKRRLVRDELPPVLDVEAAQIFIPEAGFDWRAQEFWFGLGLGLSLAAGVWFA